MEIETLGKVKLNPERIEKVRGKLPNKGTLYPYSIIPEGLYKVYYSVALDSFKLFNKKDFNQKFYIVLGPCTTTPEHFRNLYVTEIKTEAMLGEQEKEFFFLIIRKGERRTVKMKPSRRSAVNLIRREFKNSDIYISFMGQWLPIR